ncbi:hypothetical protein TAC_0090 [Acinetobacter phage TAC1]|nr:hypothetical protein TAC_0090 [Acinetobacter phage TAC1]
MDFGIVQEETKGKSIDFSKVSDKDLKQFLTCTKHVFKSESAFFTWVRSGLRQGLWMKHPIKMEMLNSQRYKIKNPRPNPRKGSELVWGYDCACCGGQFTAPNVEVDHIVGEHSLKTIEDVVTFFKKIMLVTPSDLQIVCKECHAIKTYAERYGVSEKKARAIKKAIAAVKDGIHQEELERLGVKKLVPKTKARDMLADLYEREDT